MRNYYTYIMASQKNGTLYVGVTNNLEHRINEHKSKVNKGFTEKYNINKLVWFASGDSIVSAIELEKKIKNRGRQWKVNLIEKDNQNWDDLSNRWNVDSRVKPENDRGGSAQNDRTSNQKGDTK